MSPAEGGAPSPGAAGLPPRLPCREEAAVSGAGGAKEARHGRRSPARRAPREEVEGRRCERPAFAPPAA